jgi:hypothetical protein
MPFQRTPKEKAESKKLKAAIQTFSDVIADPDASLRQKSDARREEKKTRAALEALETRIAERKLKYVQDEYVEAAQERFPEIATKASPNRETILSELRNYLNSLDSGPECLRAHQYIGNLIHGFENQIKSEQNEAREAERQAEARQEQLDFVACEKAKKELYETASPYFLQPRTLESRRNVEKTFRERAEQWEAIAKTRGEAVDETGAHQTAIALACAETYELLANRVAVFDYDPEWQPSDEQLKKKFGWLLGLPIEENWTFRSADGRPSEEQAQLRVALLRWRQLNGYSTDDIPVVPFPTKIPRSVRANPATLAFGDLSKIREQDRKEQLERKRLQDLEDLRIEDPEKYKKLDKKALKPIPVEDEVVVYYVECRTLDHPRLPDVLYWPDGSRAILGQDIHYDAQSRKFWVEDISIEWLGPSQRAQISEAEAEIANQLSVAEWMQPWNDHIIHHDASPTIAPKQIIKKATPFYRRVVKVLKADHMPVASDPRHPRNGGQFRLGSFYGKDQCEAADKQMAAQGLRLFDGISRPPEPITLTSKPEGKRRDSDIWAAREKQIEGSLEA